MSPRREPRFSADDIAPRLTREWLVTNGLGGYASGTISGAVTRRYHGLLVAALPAPLGRTVMLNHLREELRIAGGRVVVIGGGDEPDSSSFESFHLDLALPVWRYVVDGAVIEKRIMMPHFQNTVIVQYHLLEGDALRLRLRPACHFRSHEAPVDTPLAGPYRLDIAGNRCALHAHARDLPPLRFQLRGGERTAFVSDPHHIAAVTYDVEHSRGYEAIGDLYSAGYLRAELTRAAPVSLVASTEDWTTIEATAAYDADAIERERRRRLISIAAPAAHDGVGAELVLAADQFVIRPAGRVAEQARAEAAGRQLRTIIAGYHWFTDWGRDTMISLEGLTLCTGRDQEAGDILRTFAQYARDGLIPNMFPDQATEGLYHTADATLWFFHAAQRYLDYTGDESLIDELLPVFRGIIDHHLRGTRFGIRVDHADGLLTQGEEGYQLTWMDAKVDGWVVTPRRGKAVELNALWYNALRITEGWLRSRAQTSDADLLSRHAERARASFNARFPNPRTGWLNDIVDGEAGDDDACRPNQVFALSLDHPVLDEAHWSDVLSAVREQLLTPVGLRSLAPGHTDYKRTYHGDLRTRDAAYHQGTVWGWLIGPFIDAWLRCHPGDLDGARALLRGFVDHLDEFGVGTIAEIFDAEEPYTPRGCIAQAWSIAEVLRCWIRTAQVTREPTTV